MSYKVWEDKIERGATSIGSKEEEEEEGVVGEVREKKEENWYSAATRKEDDEGHTKSKGISSCPSPALYVIVIHVF